LNHYAAPEFWQLYQGLPVHTRILADRAFALLKTNPRHPSLHFKKIGQYWSARLGLHHRALGLDVTDGVLWIWIGTHSEYDVLVG